jgi:hypothetical protein
MTALRWESAPGGVRHGEFVDVPGVGRYLVKRSGKSSRQYVARLNGKMAGHVGPVDVVKAAVQRDVDALRAGALNRAAVSTTSSPLPKAADLTESIRVLLMGGAPPWVQNVEQRDEHTLCVLSEGRVFEVTVR